MKTREIKFRAWSLDDKDYLEGNEIYANYLSNIHYFNTCKEMSLFKSARYIFQQYTGLKDNNGKEIYEGDIVKFNNNRVVDLIQEVKYDEEGVGFLPFVEEEAFYGAFENPEVIGNTYENPELLEKSK